MNNILSIDILLPGDVAINLAHRVKQRRLELNLTQEGLSRRAGLKLPTYRRFERTGEISLNGLLRIAFGLDMLQDFELLFSQRQYQSIDDVISGNSITRKRGQKNA